MLRNTSCEQLDLFQYTEYHRIPKNNILLQVESEISLAFTNDLLADKYNKTFGRPAWNPEIMVRIGVLQKMYQLSDEAVIDEIAVNRAFEYFCHLSLLFTAVLISPFNTPVLSGVKYCPKTPLVSTALLVLNL